MRVFDALFTFAIFAFWCHGKRKHLFCARDLETYVFDLDSRVSNREFSTFNGFFSDVCKGGFRKLLDAFEYTALKFKMLCLSQL